ncbi:MAG: adenosylmethionine decarboxylase [Candidatus Hodarchaeales archaeon]|jgi:S-adenosylmethionine decarboxylase proenzyme
MTNISFPSNILDQVAKKASLAEGSEGVRSILMQLYRHPEGINNKLLSQLTGIPVPVLSATRQELIKANLLAGITTFTEIGIDYATNELGLSKLPKSISLENWDPFNSTLLNQVQDVIGKKEFIVINSLLKERPEPLKELDQSRATEETIYRRFLFMLINGHVEGRSISLLGDDDGLSILLLASRLSRSITVFDIDTRILEFINSCSESISKELFPDVNTTNISNNKGNKITTVEWDLRKPFTRNYSYSQEVVFTDPPYTVPGARLFLHRGRELLDEQIGLPLYLAFGPKEPQAHWELQLSSLNYGFMLTELKKQFNLYRGNLRLGQFSDLYVYQIVNPKSRLVQQTHLGELYTREVKNRIQKWSETQDKLTKIGDEKENADIIVGFHLIAELINIPIQHFSVDFLKSSLLEACQEAELTIIDVYTYLFSPHGLTIIVILQESHISIHTWPEYQFISLDIFVCEEQTKAEKALDYLTEKLQPKKITKLPVIRGEYSKEKLK